MSVSKAPIGERTLAFKRFAILASGKGSNARELIAHWKNNPDNYSIELVVTDNPNAPVIEKAQELGVKCLVVPFIREGFKNFADAKKDHERRIIEILREHKVNWLLLAGYMRIMGEDILSEFHDENLGLNRVVNVHPSLLPSFKGKDGIKDAFDYGVKYSGITIHFVENDVDAGPIIKQKGFARFDGDTLEEFRNRGHQVEHEIYPQVVDLIAKEKFECRLDGNRKYIVTKES